MINWIKKFIKIKQKKEKSSEKIVLEKIDLDENVYNFNLNAYNEVVYVANILLEKGKVVIDIKDLVTPKRRRVIDFLSGVVFSKNGKIQKISHHKFFLKIKIKNDK